MGSQDNSVIVRSFDEQSSGMLVDWPRFDAPPKPVRSFFKMLTRRIKLVIFVVLALNLVAFEFVSRLTPRYTAEADLLISPRQQQVVDLKAVLAELSGDSDVIESEIQVMRSRDIARNVVQQLDLDKLPEFNPVLAAPGIVARANTWLHSRLQAYAPGLLDAVSRQFHRPTPVNTVSPAEPPRDPLASPVDTFLRHLGVTPRGHSRVISVTFDSDNPRLAAQAANTVTDAYIANQLKAKQDATSSAHRWLNERVAELREEMLNADTAVQNFRQKASLTQGRNGPLSAEEISNAADQVIKAKAFATEVDARLRAATAGRFHAQGLEQASQAAHDRVAALEALSDQLRLQSEAGDRNEVEMRVLQREADADRALYDRLLLRLKETNIESGLQVPDAQIVSHAEPPTEPAFPRVGIIMTVVFVTSCMVAGLLALVLESLSAVYSSAEQAERQLGFPTLGIIPAVRRRWSVKRNPETMVLQQPSSAFSETIRGLYTSLMLSRGAGAPKILLIASAMPKEGKSSTVLALGRMMASCGKSVVIVDCDLHRGRLRHACDSGFGLGLLDFLGGDAGLEDVIHCDRLSPASIIPAGRHRHTAPDLIGSRPMQQLLAQLSERFDLVLLDSAPLLATSDTRNLCRLADRTVLVVRWNVTPQSSVSTALRQILESGGNVAGCVLTRVSLRRYSRYSTRSLQEAHLGPYLLR